LETADLVILCGLFFGAAALYTSVGHAGASAYLAAMALMGVAHTTMRPTALVLNVIVAAIGTWRYVRAGRFSWPALWPLVIGAAPMAFLGGWLQLPGEFYRPLVGILLWIAAIRFVLPGDIGTADPDAKPPLAGGLAAGGTIGLLSGLTGTGGGIFLSPLLILLKWTEPTKTLGVASAFILVNSVAGLAGNLASVGSLPAELPWFLISVLAGTALGTTAGITLFARPTLLKALAVVLAIAGAKLVFF